MEHITAIITSGDFNQFIGLAEDAVLEVKQQPYDLDNSAAERYELAKDVSALANAGGGYIIVGLSTRREPNREVDIVDALNLIAVTAFSTTQYEGIIGDHVYPRIRDLAVNWHQGNGSNDGLGVILVPPQREDDKPFITAKVAADDAYLKEIVIGYAERSDAANDPLTPKRLQDALKKGRDSHSRRLTRIEGMLERLIELHAPPAPPPEPAPEATTRFDEQNLEARIDAIVEDVE